MNNKKKQLHYLKVLQENHCIFKKEIRDAINYAIKKLKEVKYKMKAKTMKQKDLNKLTVAELETTLLELNKKKKEVNQPKGTPDIIGKNYLIRTVTMIYTGKLEAIYPEELVLTNCAWIAETERWADTCAKGVFKEVEPYPKDKKIIIGKSAILDRFMVDWELPTKQK